MTDPGTGNLSALVADNSQRIVYVANVNDMEVCLEALSSRNAVCSEKFQNSTEMDGISNKTHQKQNQKQQKSGHQEYQEP